MFHAILRTSMIAAAVLFFSGWQCGSAKAEHWYGSYFSFYRGLGPNVYTSGQLPVPPYFAVHPPVYYGLHMVRHYGYNAFTCPCTPPEIHYRHPATYLETEEEGEIEPVRIANRFAQDGAMAKSNPTAPSMAEPLRIVNPFCQEELARR